MLKTLSIRGVGSILAPTGKKVIQVPEGHLRRIKVRNENQAMYAFYFIRLRNSKKGGFPGHLRLREKRIYGIAEAAYKP